MCERSAAVYDALRRNKDYAGVCAELVALIGRLHPQARTLLDVGCGTGRHLQHLREAFAVEGIDASPRMLSVARTRCPSVPFHEGRMETFALPRRFDVVTCLFGSVGYTGTPTALRQAVGNMAAHLAADGLLIVEPWLSPSRFVEGRAVLDTAEEPDLKVARAYVARRQDNQSVFDSTYVVVTAAGVEVFTERETLGLFTDAEYDTALRDAGLRREPAAARLFGYGLLVGRAGA